MVFPFQQPPPHYVPPGRMGMVPRSMNRPPANTMIPAENIQGAPRGNIIKNLLQKFSPANGAQQATSVPPQAAGGTPSTGGGLTGTLNNVQHVLNVVQQAAPIVQEYGPMVKNLPAMLRMAKAFKDTNNEPEISTNQQPSEQSVNSPEANTKNTPTIQKDNNSSSTHQEKAITNNDGESKPLLFI